MPKVRTLKGDTLVEVIFAFAILGFIIMSIMLIMQQGTSAAQLSLEVGLVRNQMDSQAEAIRFINAAQQSRLRTGEAGQSSEYRDIWDRVISKKKNSVTKWSEMTKKEGGRMQCINPSTIPNAFILNVKNLRSERSVITRGFSRAEVFPRLLYQGWNGEIDNNNTITRDQLRIIGAEGIWVEVAEVKTRTEIKGSKAYDFHIRACWEPAGRSTPLTLGTIVRVHVATGAKA